MSRSQRFFAFIFLGCFAFTQQAKSEVTEEQCIASSTKIEQKLRCLHGLKIASVSDVDLKSGYRTFDLKFTQPVDHSNPASGIFTQRLVLLHRGEAEPMILQTSGYSIFGISQTVMTSLFATNQIQVEHRFFSDSKPEVMDWSKLDIKQSADDFHAITVAFKKIYGARWVNTGSSKGGMTSIYHRRYYPKDLDGTVANVAPLSFSTSDKRYVDFVDNVGGAEYKTCRENFKKMQISLLKNRSLITPTLSGSFQQLGSVDVAFEHSVIESMFYFWQYGNPDDPYRGCKAIPAEGTVQQMLTFLQSTASISDYSDEGLSKFIPYFYQAATQLGNPDNFTSHLEAQRLYDFKVDQYTPKGVNYTYSNSAMHDVDQWVRSEGDKILFIYGQFDPWTAGEFPVSETGKDVYKYFVPKGNHGANLSKLPPAEISLAVNMLANWLGKKPVFTVSTLNSVGARSMKTLEALEFSVRQRSHK